MSRNLSDLKEPFREHALQFSDACKAEGIEVLIYCTKRTFVEQAVLYRQGRSFTEISHKADELRKVYEREDLSDILMGVGPQRETRIVTWAGPGQSLHNYGYAFDGCPLKQGKAVWGTSHPDDIAMWATYGFVAKELGLEWAGDWPKAKREFPHVQFPGVNWRTLIGEK